MSREFDNPIIEKMRRLIKSLSDEKLINLRMAIGASGILQEIPYPAEVYLQDVVSDLVMELHRREIQLDNSQSGPKLNDLKIEHEILYACIAPDGVHKVWHPVSAVGVTRKEIDVYNYFGEYIGTLEDFDCEKLELVMHQIDGTGSYHIRYKLGE